MKHIVRIHIASIIAFTAVLFIPFRAIAQCSDAGVCSVGEHASSSTEFTASLDYLIGSSGKPDNIDIHNINLTTRYSYFFVILPYVVKSFKNEAYTGSQHGIGDVIVGGSYSFPFDRDPYISTDSGSDSVWTLPTNSALTFDIAGKFPTGSINKNDLPLRYQNGLGTTDLLLGATFSLPYYNNPNEGNWLVGLGFQLPFGISGNRYDSLKRGPDLLARLSYSRDFSDIRLTCELLAIKRLRKSTLTDHWIYTTEQSPDPIYRDELEIENSDNLQLNINVSADYRISEDVRINAGIVIPMLKREDNTDGLTRAYTILLGVNLFY